MAKKITLLLILTTLLGILTRFANGNSGKIRVAPDFGCTSGRKYGLFHHRDMAACKGTWKGHVGGAGLCSSGWHVCNWNDSEKLSSISYYRASHIDGCYALNAAQNKGICQECNENTNELAGIGADCPRIDDTARRSCLETGRIDSTHPLDLRNFTACSYRPWMTGVLCCKEKKKGAKPSILLSPTSTIRVPTGQRIVLKCQASGDPLPRITWFKNGYPVAMDGLFDDITINGNEALSKVIIPQAQPFHDGLYICKAENNLGFVVSYSSDVTTYKAKPDLHACKNKRKQVLLYGGIVAACAGKWRGSVKKASKQLCAEGWKVCGLKERFTLHKLPWQEVTSLPGCYAYDAATSDNFACTKCTHHQKGNQMSGIGAGCGMMDSGGDSCLRSGRIDVWDDATANNQRLRKRHTCSYREGVTTGVMCCKKELDHVQNNKNSGRCSPSCGPHSHCSRKGVCKCDSNFKAVGDKCLPKHLGRKCSDVTCMNGGRCKRGHCICPPPYGGQYCEEVVR